MFTKAQIIDEIRRTAEANGGKPLGTARFKAETGIAKSDWEGKLWLRWSDALAEAGFAPNSLQSRRDESEVLEKLATFSRELGRFPVRNELEMRARSEPGFPWPSSLSRFGHVHALVVRLHEFAAERGWADVVAICDARITDNPEKRKHPDALVSEVAAETIGYVYLLKSGKYYKIGRSNAAGRRERELQIQLPEKAEIIHEIKTDDPIGIENYWHNRFADQRENGEWFELTAKDVAAFKRRKFQ